MKEISYSFVAPMQVDEIWREIGPWVVQAIGEEAAYMDVEYIKEGARRAMNQILVGRGNDGEIEVVLVAETGSYCGKKTLILRWLSGREMDNWFHHIGYVENWAAHYGYERIEVWGRAGWARKLKPHGYRHEFTNVTKFLTKRMH